MTSEFFDFTDDDSDEKYEFDQYMNVRAFLQAHFGGTLGSKIYKALKRVAVQVAEENGDSNGIPAIMFRGKGGTFASIHVAEDEADEDDFDGTIEGL